MPSNEGIPKTMTKTKQTKLKTWLKNKGHDAAKVDGKKFDTDVDAWDAVLELHGIDPTQYRGK